MKIRIEIDATIEESEIVIRAPQMTEELLRLQKVVFDEVQKSRQIVFYKGEKEFYFDMKNILFFTTNDRQMDAHTGDSVFLVKNKLYELESNLPSNFVRVSKSTILNVDHVFSLTKNITSVSEVEFANTYKKVLVSRHYFNFLQEKLESRRANHEKSQF